MRLLSSRVSPMSPLIAFWSRTVSYQRLDSTIMTGHRAISLIGIASIAVLLRL